MPVKNPLLQEERINYLTNLHGNEKWVTVYSNERGNGLTGGLSACLIPPNKLKESMKRIEWDLLLWQGKPGFITQYKNGEEISTYHRISSSVEPLFHLGTIHTPGKCSVELCEEFRLFHNIYYDSIKGEYLISDESDNEENPILVFPDRIKVLNKLLRSYIAAKQMHLLLFFEYTQYMPNHISEDEEHKYRLSISNEHFMMKRWAGNSLYLGDEERESFSRIQGKKAVICGNIEECGIGPYSPPENYQEFKIGEDESGKDIIHTCDPAKLSDYFGKNPRAPHYLTPVYFCKSVLDKYYNNPDKYSVEDGLISCGNWWSFRIDNNHPNYVSAFLGDLGMDLPESERIYWLSFNISPQGGMSRTNFRRSFLAEFADPELADHLFKQDYRQLRLSWRNYMGWDLFKNLHEGDQYHLNSLRIPPSKNQKEFDSQILYLGKLLIDSLHGEAIAGEIGGKLKGEKEIAILTRYMKLRGIPHYEEHSKFLHDLYKLRSSGSAHRKGRNYEKALSQLGLSGQPHDKAFETLLNKALALLRDLLALLRDMNPQAQ